MKIKKSVLVDFLKKVTMESDSKINEAIFDFKDDGVHMNAMSADNIILVNGFLRASVFENYSALGEIGFQEIPNIINIVKTFNEDLELSVKGNILDFKEKDKSVALEILDVSLMQKERDIKEIELDETVAIQSKELNTFIGDLSLNKEFDVRFNTGDNVMKVYNGVGKYKFTKVFRELDCKAGTTVGFGSPLVNAVSNLTDEIKLSLKTNFPIRIVETTANSVITIMVAPRVENTNVVEVPTPEPTTPEPATPNNVVEEKEEELEEEFDEELEDIESE